MVTVTGKVGALRVGVGVGVVGGADVDAVGGGVVAGAAADKTLPIARANVA